MAFALAWQLSSSSGFEVPAHCGDEASFRRHLSALAGADAERGRPAHVLITGPDAQGRYSLALTLADEVRTLQDDDCRTLLRSAAVIAAAAVVPASPEDPEDPGSPDAHGDPGVLPAVPSAPSQSAEPPAAPSTQLPEPPPDARPSKVRDRAPRTRVSRATASYPRGRWRGGLGAGVGLAIGIVPNVAARFEVVAEATREPWGIRVMAGALSPTEARIGARGVTVLAVSTQIVARRQLVRRLHVGLGLSADWLRGRGRGVGEAQVDGVWMLAPLLDVTAIPVDRRAFRLEFGANLRIAANRPQFQVAGVGRLYEVPRFGFLAVIRGTWKFP